MGLILLEATQKLDTELGQDKIQERPPNLETSLINIEEMTERWIGPAIDKSNVHVYSDPFVGGVYEEVVQESQVTQDEL